LLLLLHEVTEDVVNEMFVLELLVASETLLMHHMLTLGNRVVNSRSISLIILSMRRTLHVPSQLLHIIVTL
jgi:hypothetical protein